MMDSMALEEISGKTNRVLQIILLAFLAVLCRVWHLGVIQREEKLVEAQKPQQRTLLARADRGTICDRFHIPLALNRISYNAAIYYGQIAQIPAISWRADERGQRTRVYERKEYIRNLSQALASLLDLDSGRVEDLIHSKASLFPHVPFILKAGLSEEEHYRLKMLEKDWPGVHAEIAAERTYPLGKVACHVIGTLGAINQREYQAILQELWSLEQAIGSEESATEEMCRRYLELKEKAYTLNDLVGKTGVEAQFEEELRGYFGKKIFEIDQKGRFVRELPGGKPAIPGRQIVLSLSAELQEFAESLLAQDEKVRDGRSIGMDPVDKKRKALKQPWIKGGAIVAIEPSTGEVLAFASYPRFDPNDFIPSANPLLKKERQRQIGHWFESESFLANLWDGKELLCRERAKGQESVPLTWETFLDWVLPNGESAVR